jgi:hypothetical protein
MGKMHGSAAEDRNVSQISLEPGPGGIVAVYLVETGSEEETRSLRKLFAELEPHINVAQLSKGRLVSYAVQARDSSMLDELESALKNNYTFVLIQRSFDAVIYRVVKELCADTGSRLLSIPHCNICGRPDPFPDTVVTLADELGTRVMSRSYCTTCTASLVARTNKDFVLSLLSADRRDFGEIERSELIRSRARSQHLRYKVRSGVG